MFVLCDPGLLLPPDETDIPQHGTFWEGLIEWAADKRLALGPETHQLVIQHFTAKGWPAYKPPHCPEGLGGLAAGALNRLLAKRFEPVSSPVGDATLDPKYIRHEDGELAIVFDVTSEWTKPPVAIASNPCHWEKPVAEIAIVPLPPYGMELICEPRVPSEAERLAQLQRRLEGRRLTVIGGMEDHDVCRLIASELGLERPDVRWIESQPGKDPDTDRLKGMRGHRDVLCCLLGTEGVVGLGHSGSEAALVHARDRGVPHCSVHRPSEIIDAITKLMTKS